jgi:hypothetical protein
LIAAVTINQLFATNIAVSIITVLKQNSGVWIFVGFGLVRLAANLFRLSVQTRNTVQTPVGRKRIDHRMRVIEHVHEHTKGRRLHDAEETDLGWDVVSANALVPIACD